MNLKTVIFMLVISVVWSRREGSGGGLHFISDDSDLDYEGSGEDLDSLLLIPDDGSDDDSYDIPFEPDSQDYDDDLNEYINSDDDDYYDADRDLILTADEDDADDAESVLKIVEIEPKPEENEVILETSQILIMVGSGFVSFGIAMLSFFLCKRSMEKRKQKAKIVNQIKTKQVQSSSPIVKNYHLVPSDTQEYLKQDTHIDMFRGDSQTSCDPLIK